MSAIKYYAGIGSRETPHEIISLMIKIAEKLGRDGYCLRSGGADGADLAFEKGADNVSGAKEIYLPWKGFNGSNSSLYIISSAAYKVAERFHPGYQWLSEGARKLQARNTYQVLGANLQTRSEFVVCWTKDGADGAIIPTSRNTGGTGQAIRIASAYGILVYNLGNQTTLNKVLERYK